MHGALRVGSGAGGGFQFQSEQPSLVEKEQIGNAGFDAALLEPRTLYTATAAAVGHMEIDGTGYEGRRTAGVAVQPDAQSALDFEFGGARRHCISSWNRVRSCQVWHPRCTPGKERTRYKLRALRF